ncbi:MAG: hypothetical protein JWQ11_2069 [Rhizobacter sp.]|nr:hypothetical protein [Rhizobacter sp.]
MAIDTAFMQAAGEHALIGFVVVLPLLLLAVSGVWWTFGRYAVPREQSRLPPAAFLAMHLGAGFAVLIGAAYVFAEIAEELGGDEVMGRLDQAFTDGVRSVISPAKLRLFALLTHVGDPMVLGAIGVVVAVLLLRRHRRWLAGAYLATLAGQGLLNLSLKHIFARVRPIHDNGISIAEGFSFPSGHTSGSIVTYGMLAYIAVRLLPRPWQLPAVLVCTTLAYTAACSRLFLQVHFASDVVAGFASGIAWLSICILSIELTRMYWRRNQQSALSLRSER